MRATARGLGLAGNLQSRAGSAMGERYYNFVDITRKSMFATQGETLWKIGNAKEKGDTYYDQSNATKN